ncbi:MAG: ATP-binding protein [Candidatus Omnitrophica bacterium]|nr:ATP-binding protein [Candidatus Omnitrophota bacterium]
MPHPLASLTQRLRRFRRRLRHRLLSRQRRRYQEILRAASLGMTRIRNLPRLLNLIARVTASNTRAAHVTIFLRNKTEPGFTVATSHGKFRKPVGELCIEESSALVTLLTQCKEPLVYNELKEEHPAEPKRRPRSKEHKEIPALKRALWEMERLQAAVCVPSFREGKLQGFLVLGEKLTGDLYDQDDLAIFSALASQAAWAIENAQAYEELRDTRDQLLHSERMGTIGKFAADMAHEIKNPLQAILGFFEMLPEKYDDPDFRNRFAKLAQAEAERINDLVRQLMVYSRPKAPDFKPIEISGTIDSVLALLENDLDRSHIEVRKGYSPNGVTVEADRDQMKQVFLNLFNNAIEAMSPPGEKPGLLDIVAFPNEKALVVKVRDTGSGIPENQIPLIFAPFYTTKEKGSGLGLAIVQNILRAHNAAIQVESQVGAGTTVTLTFPLRQSDLPASPQAARPSVISDELPRPARKAPSAASILIVDSEKETLETVRLIFEARGITCWTATSGPQALALLKEHQPDVILSEILLRGDGSTGVSPDGFGILQEAKRIFPERPVFLITACDFPEYREKAKEMGADGFLVKPASQDYLLSILPGPQNR